MQRLNGRWAKIAVVQDPATSAADVVDRYTDELYHRRNLGAIDERNSSGPDTFRPKFTGK